jgi:hypothetical protein
MIDQRGGDTPAQERIRDLVLEAYAEYEQRAASAWIGRPERPSRALRSLSRPSRSAVRV